MTAALFGVDVLLQTIIHKLKYAFTSNFFMDLFAFFGILSLLEYIYKPLMPDDLTGNIIIINYYYYYHY